MSKEKDKKLDKTEKTSVKGKDSKPAEATSSKEAKPAQEEKKTAQAEKPAEATSSKEAKPAQEEKKTAQAEKPAEATSSKEAKPAQEEKKTAQAEKPAEATSSKEAKPAQEEKKTAQAEKPAEATSSKEAKPAQEEKKTAQAEKPAEATSSKEAKPAQEEKKTAQAEKPAEATSSKETKSEPAEATTSSKADKNKKEPIKLDGLFAFKISMTRFYDEKGGSLPVTALKYEPSYVSQIKTEEKESYSAVQVAFKAQKNKRCSKARIQHLKAAGFKEGARFVREIKQELPEAIQVGDELSIHSLEKGDLVKISALSKGKGFTGVMKRWNFRGGAASHGSKAHRRTGSIGQHTKPGRVFPGRKMPGRHGFKQVSRLKVPVVEVLPEEGIIFVKGAVPGARHTLVSLQKMSGNKG